MPDPSPQLPQPRGPVSESVIAALRRDPGPVRVPSFDQLDAFADDLQLALWCCYELHYLSFSNVDDGWEWEPGLLAIRRELERSFTARLVDEIGPVARVPRAEVGPALCDLANGEGPSLSAHMLAHATRSQMREFVVHRSIYQRKEADPHTWAIPRLRGRAKAAMVAIQHDEYGEGRAASMHAELFATTMRAFDLDPGFAAYVDAVPGATLATDNLVTMFGLHRAWYAACVGHLALFEMSSVGPMSRYAGTLRRLGVDDDACRFYDVHVVADEVHQHVALDELVAGLLEDDPDRGGEVLFGARALSEVERRFAVHLLDSWSERRSSLRPTAAANRVRAAS